MSVERDHTELAAFDANISAIERLNMSRRWFLGLGLAGVAIAADLQITEQVQAMRNSTLIDEISTPEAKERTPSAMWLLLPGFNTGWEDAKRIASSLQNAMEDRGRVSYLGYSNEGLDIDEVKETTEAYVREENIKNIYLYGHSFSSMVALEVAAHLKKSTRVDIDLFTPDSSPSSADDVYERRGLDLLSMSYDSGLKVTSTIRGCMGLAERAANKNERSWRQVWDQSMEDLSPSAASSALMQSQANYICNFRLDDHELPPETTVAMLANLGDQTVNIRQSSAAWRSYSGEQFGGIYWTEGARPAHASPNWNSQIYSDRLRAIQHQLLPEPYELSPREKINLPK